MAHRYGALHPDEQRATAKQIISELDPKLVLTSLDLSEDLPQSVSDRLILVDEKKESFNALPSLNRFLGVRKITPKDICHISFTTNSEGALESLPVSHRDSVNTAQSLRSIYGLDSAQQCYQDPSPAFDVALEEFWAMLSAGASVVFEGHKEIHSPKAVSCFIAENSITIYSTTPATLATIVDELFSVKFLIIGGQKCSSELAVKWILKKQRIVSIKKTTDRFPSFSIEQEARKVLKPRLLSSR